MKKRIFTIFLVMLLVVTNLAVCYADTLDTLTEIGLGGNVTTWNPDSDYSNDENQNWFNGAANDWATAEGVGTGILKVIGQVFSWIFMGVAQLLISVVMLFIPHMDKIIFNEQYSTELEGLMVDWAEYCRLAFFDVNTNNTGSLASNMVSAVSSFYQVFRYVALIFFIVAIACIAVKMIISSIGKQKQQYKEALKNWLIALTLLVVGHFIMIYLIYFSEWLVEMIVHFRDTIVRYDITTGGGAARVNDLQTIFTLALGDAGAFTGGVFSIVIWALVTIISLIVYAVINIKVLKIYIERVIIVGVLIMVFPLVTVMYAFEKGGLRKGNTFESWLRTFVEQVYVQPIHALALTFVMLALCSLPLTFSTFNLMGPILVLMVLNMVFAIENIIKKLISVQGAAMGTPKDAMGMMAPFAGYALGKFGSGFGNTKGGFGKKVLGGITSMFSMGGMGLQDKDPTKRGISGLMSRFKPDKDQAVNVMTKALAAGGLSISGNDKKGGKDEQRAQIRATVRAYKDCKSNPGDTAKEQKFNEEFRKLLSTFSSDEIKAAKDHFTGLNIGSSGSVDDKMMFLAGCRCSEFNQGAANIMMSGGITPAEQAVLVEHVLKGDSQVMANDCAIALNINTGDIANNLRLLAGRFGDELKDAIENATGATYTDLSTAMAAVGTTGDYQRVVYSLAHPDVGPVQSLPDATDPNGSIAKYFNKKISD